MKRDTRRTGVFTRRALLLMGGQVAVLGGLAARLYEVQIVEGGRYATLAEANRVSQRAVAAPRGRILDRFGTAVAGNKLNWRAVLIAEQTPDVETTLDAFGRIVPLDDRERARILREVRRHRRFIPVMVRDFLGWDEMARIEVNATELPGIMIDVGTTRVYPFSDQLSHVIGYVAPPNEVEVADDPQLALPGIRVGRAGMEKQHDLALRGHAGEVQLEVNAYGRVIRELDRQEGVQGEEVGLTIDAALQQAVLGHLGEESASAVVLDCTNGEVLAMASTPSFDPSLFNSGVSQAQWVEWTSNRRAPLINKSIAGLYAPGSTFKMAVAVAALESRAITPNDRIDCPGYLDLGDSRFHCWKKGGHGLLDLHGGIKNSCDVFFYETARRTGIDHIAAAAHKFGLGTDLAIDLPGARTGLIPTREWRIGQGGHWNIGDTIVSGIGQGYVEVTPLQLATYVARVATGRADRADPDAGVADRPGRALEHRRHDRQRHRSGLRRGDAAAACDLCRAGGDRARRRAASDAPPGWRATDRGAGRGLAEPGRAAALPAACARGDVVGGQRTGRHGTTGPAAGSEGAACRQDRLGPGARRLARGA
jgi:penicillin-binding protein 2